MLACLYFRQANERGRSILKATAFGAVFSFAMEAAQLFIPYRVASIYDVLANTAGALGGALVFADPFYSLVTRPLGERRGAGGSPGAWGDAARVLLAPWIIPHVNPALPFFRAGNIRGTEEGA